MDDHTISAGEEHEPLIRVAALHALAYCERLFYLEEVEEIRVADESVYAGRTLHEQLGAGDGESVRSFELSSEKIGLVGRVDGIEHREGGWVPYEHKRGRARRESNGDGTPWPSDELQAIAYAMLLEEFIQKPVTEARIRYHADSLTVRVPLTPERRQAVLAAVRKARALRIEHVRPAVSPNERICIRCSLAPVCLPEEERLVKDSSWEPIRLFPPLEEGTIVHVVTPGARVSKSGETLTVSGEDVSERKIPIQGIRSVVIHGHVQMTTQALHLCASQGIPVHWVTGGGTYVGALSSGAGMVHRRLRQYQALSEPGFCLKLARRVAIAKTESQLRFVLRATRGDGSRNPEDERGLEGIRKTLHEMGRVEGADGLRGLEGTAARYYFETLPRLLVPSVAEEMKPKGRSQRPPRDRFNAILSFGYSLLYRSVLEGILAVGLEPALGFYHTPRSAAHPLVLDVMELFRVPVWDMTVVASVNRGQWGPESDFNVSREKIWLSDMGRRKAIDLYERRLEDEWKHPVVNYSLSYGRMIELEVRLLEKEWTSEPGLFGQLRLR